MRQVVTRSLVALALAGALAGPALAQGSPSPAPVTTSTVWRVRMAERDVGREVAQALQVDAADGAPAQWVVSARAELDLTGTPLTMTTALRLDAATGAFLAYELASEAGGQPQAHIEVAPVGTAVHVGIDLMGNHYERTLAVQGGAAGEPLLVLDNLVFCHYDALGREAVRRAAPFSCTVLVPQTLLSVAGTWTPLRAVRGRLGGVERPAGLGTVRLGNTLGHVTYDRETGRAYKVVFALQRIEATVEGWVETPEAGVPAASDYREEEVAFPSSWGRIPGTLTLPPAGRGPGPFPAAVLLAGSGPQDRDEAVGPNRPLRDLARGLAARGVATLRFDKRTYLIRRILETPPVSAADRRRCHEAMETLTLREESIEDGAAALAWLRRRAEVRGDALFVAGHSLGALAAPDVAALTSGVRGLVLLAGPGRRLDALLEEQVAFQRHQAGAPLEEATVQAQQLGEAIRALLAPDAEGWEFGASAAYWRDVLGRDLGRAAGALGLDVLLLQGEADCQVRVRDYELLRAALQAARVPHEAHLFPGLNHLFMRVDGESTGAEYALEGTVAPEVVGAIAAWVHARLR